jgi:hypothetical protein
VPEQVKPSRYETVAKITAFLIGNGLYEDEIKLAYDDARVLVTAPAQIYDGIMKKGYLSRLLVLDDEITEERILFSSIVRMEIKIKVSNISIAETMPVLPPPPSAKDLENLKSPIMFRPLVR